jgi:flagellin-like hook-associated protein FlgL
MSILSIIGGMVPDQTRLRERIGTLTRQVSTGEVGQTHGALGFEAQRAIDLRGDIARREAYLGATDTALGRMGSAQSVLGRLETLAQQTAAEAARARTLGAAAVEQLALSARIALEEAATLLNARHAGEYLFAGSNLALAPVPGAEGIATGPMAAGIAAAVATIDPDPANLGPLLATTAAVATNPASTPFNAWLEGAGLTDPRRAVVVADGERVAWGVLANQDQSGESAGAWGREMLRGLATLAALTPASAAQGAGYDALLREVGGGLRAAGDGIAAERSALGVREQRVMAVRERHADLLVALRTQLGQVEEVDVAEVTARLRQAELRLSASYETTGMISRLSLAALLR